ncbi:MAG: DNA alkylation repair protein [Nitrospirota bacterium]
MAEPLKTQFGVDIPRRIAGMIEAVHPRFPTRAFLADALDGYEHLELTPRARRIARSLAKHLPENYERAIEILLRSLGPRLERTEGQGMAPFLYLPHVFFVAEHGLDHFEPSMRAQYELTQRFTAEFSIRAFLVRCPERTLARLATWASDPDAHVRRLVSEGSRPRLPWAPRLRAFQRDPRPVLALLERLKDDPELYVRRSVANNLNDIGKDHPAVLVETCRRWMTDVTPERGWIVRHALRSAVKRGDRSALAILGYGHKVTAAIRGVSLTPTRARVGGAVSLAFDVVNTSEKQQHLLIDFKIHFMKANGSSSPKVFKLKAINLAPRGRIRLGKTVSLREMTTRTHYPGTHRVEILVNGTAYPAGAFTVIKPARSHTAEIR